ncbi:MAG: efflux RND transporter permease subunit [Acidobacteria bacterium]|nr:efflux RND transporter permease subunit [Acidobacteriota bacterium]MDA1233521.1 efflux RND transporter permease subunit [Acidobacteriota bacterium]
MHEPGHETDGATQTGSAIAAFSIRRPVTIAMVFVSLLVMGFISIGRIPLVLLPSVTFPGLFVYVPYPNATPEQIQQSITKPLEEVLATISGVERMSSTSGADFSQVAVFFSWSTDIGIARAEISEKIDQVRADLPDDVRQVLVRGFDTDDIPIIEGVISSKRDLHSDYDFIDRKLKKPLERIPGIAETELWGLNRQQLDVYLRTDDLKRYQVDVGRLYRTLNSVNTNISLGMVEDGGARHGAISKSAITSVDDIAQFPVNERGLRLGQVADIVFDQPIRNNGQHLNGEYAIGFSVRKSSEANTVETVEQAIALIDALSNDPELEGLEVHIWHDAGKEIVESLSGLLGAGTIGAGLAVFTLFLFLRRMGPSLAIGAAIPFSVIATIGFLYLGGGTLNLLSMMGLMLAAGMLVDNAVVVLESIYQKMEKGLTPFEAAKQGAGEVTTAVIAATLTTIIVFVPLVFGSTTQLSVMFKHAGVAIIVALLCSLFVSLTVIPLMSARLGRFSRFFTIAQSAGGRGRITEAYLRAVRWPLRRRFLTGFVLAPGLVIASGWVLKNVVPDNTPDAQEGMRIDIQYDFSENFHYVKIENDYVGPVEEFLAKNKERFKISDYMSRYSNNGARSMVFFDADTITVKELQQVRDQLKDELPVIPGAEIRLSGGGENGGDSWITANILGDDPSELARVSAELRVLLQQNPQFAEVQTNAREAREEVKIRLDRDRARKYGLSPQDVSQVLNIVVRAQQMRGFRTDKGEVEMWLRIDPADMQSISDLKGITVGAAGDGTPITLEQVADVSVGTAPGSIGREDRQTFSFLMARWNGDSRADGQKAFQEVLNSYVYPTGYGWSFGFFTRQGQSENKEAMFNLLLSLFMVYFVMASLFESLSHPFSIMLSLPFGIVGVAGMLWVTNTPFNLMAVIGGLVLIGIVVNNGIVLIDHINNLRRSGMSRDEAVIEGCRERLRPIAMTAATTIVGMVPLAFGDSSLAGMRYFPMARTIMGGLMASTVLTLIVLPTYYTLVDDFGVYLSRLWFMTSPDREHAAAEGD